VATGGHGGRKPALSAFWTDQDFPQNTEDPGGCGYSPGERPNRKEFDTMSMTPDRTEDLRDVHRRIRNMLASFRASTWSGI